MNEKPIGRYVRNRLTALPDGQPLSVLSLASDMAERFYPHLPSNQGDRLCEQRLGRFFIGPHAKWKWAQREDTVLVKAGHYSGRVFIWLLRLKVGAMLAEQGR